MTPGVLSLSTIVARLEVSCPSLREVADAAGYAAARSKKLVFPAAYVVPLEDRAGPNRYASCEVAQPITARFAVVLVARDLRHDRGSRALSELEAARAETRSALVGWTPPEATDSLRLVSGRLISAIDTDGALVWQEDWSAALDLRSIP